MPVPPPRPYPVARSRTIAALPVIATLCLIALMQVLREGYGIIVPAPSIYFLALGVMSAVWVGFRGTLLYLAASLPYLGYLYVTQVDYLGGAASLTEYGHGTSLTPSDLTILAVNVMVGALFLYLGLQRDRNASSSQHAIESRELLQSMLDNFPTIITFKDLEGRYIEVNRGVERALGVPREHLLGWADHELFPPEVAKRYQDQDRRIVGERKSMQYLEEVPVPNGEPYYFLETSFPLIDSQGKVYGVGRIAHDVTEQEQTRLKLQRAYDVAVSAQATRSDFMAVMSHELRTPLQSIIGYTELMLDGIGGTLTPSHRDSLERVTLVSEHLSGLIEQLLDYAKLETGRKIMLNPAETDMNDLVRRSAATLSGQARAKGLDLHIAVPQEPIEGYIDPGRVRQILINLVGNAIKFTESGHVAVELRTHAPWDPWFTIAVTDTGVGIPEGDLGRIFDPFWQVESGDGGNNKYRQLGTGLGLAITQEYIIAMEGSIDVTSKPGQGSVFEVKLPKAPAA